MIDHIACASFEPAATHRFYADVLGARLKSAMTGDDGEHLYVRDPNDLVIEFSVAAAPSAERADAAGVVRRWIETTAAR